MPKPSKKVAGIMIIIVSITIAFIAADKIKSSNFSNTNSIFEGEIKSDDRTKSISEYMVEKFESQKTDSENYEEPKTVTEFALVELIGNYKSLKDQSQNNPENIDDLTTRVAAQTQQFTNLPSKYFILGLQTFPDYEKAKAKRYGNEFARITEEYYKQRFFIEEKDSLEYVKKYAGIQSSYAEDLSKLEIPRSISDEHLDYINNLYKISIAIVKLAETDNDPLLSGLILNQYNQIRTDQPKILISISDYFINNDIIFSDNETGAMWNNI